MAETVIVNGQILYSPLLACRPVRLEDYTPDRLRVHKEAVAESGADPFIYPGSVFLPCEDCGIEVALGPRGQEARELALGIGLDPHVVCFADSVERAAKFDEVRVMGAGNPFMPKKNGD